MGEVSRRLNNEEQDISQVPVSADMLAALLKRIDDGTISNNAAKQVMDALWAGKDASFFVGSLPAISGQFVSGESTSLESSLGVVDQLVDEMGLKQMNDSGALEKIIDEVMAANVPMVEQYRAGKDKAFNALVGLVMKASKGKANPQQANDLLKQKLG
jgi:aspartyl-tRNA(Asn)/glutamyl-tRNA(Gln) amidotransferase subunit B